MTAPEASVTYHYAVTAGDIEKGTAGDGHDCPVARAIQRRHGLDPEKITVGGRAYYRPTTEHAELCARFPTRIRGFIFDFDRFRPVKPTRFTLTWEAL